MASHINYRVIARFSLDDDAGSQVRNNCIRKHLEQAGFTNTATGAWETPASSIIEIQRRFNDLFEELSHLTVDDWHKTTLDHMWIYIDKV